MDQKILAAIIIAIGFVLGGFLAGGRYSIVSSDPNAAIRLDRFTGQVSMCIPGASDNCGAKLAANK